MIAMIGLQFPMPLATRYLIDRVLPAKDWSMLLILLVAMLAVTIVSVVSSLANNYLLSIVRERVIRDLQLSVFEHVQNLPLEYFDSTTPGRLLSRIAVDTGGVSGLLGDTLLLLVVDSVSFVTGVVVVMLFHLKLALAALSILPLLVFATLRFKGPLRLCANEMAERVGRSGSVMAEALDGIRLTKAYNLETWQAGRMRALQDASFYTSVQYTWLASVSGSTTSIITSLIPLIVYGYGGYEIMHGRMTLGTLIAFNAFFAYVSGPAQRVFMLQGSLQSSIAALGRLDGLSNVREEGNGIVRAKSHLEARSAGSVEFDNVSFGYRPESRLLHDISLKVRDGERIALVGRSGIGKSTLMHLLMRFYEPDSGHIFVGGKDYTEFALKDLRTHVTIIPQSTYLFAGTIGENIRCANLGASDMEVFQAARLAYADEFIRQLPDGYESQVGARGAKLSGGERQRIAIARAILRNPRILILDEATSEVDALSERLIQDALVRFLPGRTTFIVAHHFSGIREADRIAIMEEGRIAEEGNHDYLYESSSIYRSFVDALAMRQSD
jgi:ABC-type multidrug transport system fused ATPase/permease subunit